MKEPVSKKLTKKQIEILEWMAAGIKFRDAETELGLADRSLKGRVQKVRKISGRKRPAALVYWGLTEMYIYQPRLGLPRMRPRWIQVVELMAQDLSNRQIADKLHISELTVESRIRYARAGVGARTEAQLLAICWGEDWIA